MVYLYFCIIYFGDVSISLPLGVLVTYTIVGTLMYGTKWKLYNFDVPDFDRIGKTMSECRSTSVVSSVKDQDQDYFFVVHKPKYK